MFLFAAPNLSLKGEGQAGLIGAANPSLAVLLVVLGLLLVALVKNLVFVFAHLEVCGTKVNLTSM